MGTKGKIAATKLLSSASSRRVPIRLKPWGDDSGSDVCELPSLCTSRGGSGLTTPPPPPKKALKMAARDKESLLEEIVILKQALADQAHHIKLHKAHHNGVCEENRRLERDIQDLEVQGMEAMRTGSPSKLKAKLEGLKARLEEVEGIANQNHEELNSLRKDPRVSRTHEVEVERDVFAQEVRRLQKLITKLKSIHHKVAAENKELTRLKEKMARLDITNQRLESCISAVHQSLDKSNREIMANRNKVNECRAEVKQGSKKLKDLQDHSDLLEGLLHKERVNKREKDKRIQVLEFELRSLEREQRMRSKRPASS